MSIDIINYFLNIILAPSFLIIKYLLKSTYNITKKEFHFTQDGEYIRTVKYFFTPQPDSSSLSK